jgi:molybdate transport system substrate-binding protein
MPAWRRLAWVLSAAVLVAAGCRGSSGPQHLRVFVAASLEPVLWAARDAAAPAQVPVDLHAAASGTLVRQILSGARADVFVSAHPQWMEALAEAGRVRAGDVVNVARNRLVLVAGRGLSVSPACHAALAGGIDFVDPEGGHTLACGRLATGDPDYVPLGQYARQALEAAGWWPALSAHVVRMADARAVVAAVTSGAVETGIAYASDVRGLGGIRVLAEVPDTLHEPILYQAAALVGAPEAARDWVADLRSTEVAAAFEAHGFVAAAAPR